MNGQSGIIELINVAQDPAWLAWGVQYFFLIGVSIGAFLLTLPRYLWQLEQYDKAARLALIVALCCAIAAPVALVSDLHQPARFYQFYLHPTPTSWMSWGSFLLPSYVLLLLVYAWLIYRPGLALQATRRRGLVAALSKLLAMGGSNSQRLVTLAGWLTLVSALLVALYTGTEMAVVKARPLWHGPMMPLLFLITGISGAAGFSLLLNRLLADNDIRASQQLGRVMGQGLSLVLVVTLLWFLAGASGASASGQALQRLAMEYNPLSFTLVWLLLCSLLPLVLLGLVRAQYYWLAGSLALLGAWMFRWSMFMDGQRIPKTGAGFYDYGIPLGHEGWLGMLGTLGLCVALLVILTSILPWQAEAPGASAKQPPIRHTDLQEKHS